MSGRCGDLPLAKVSRHAVLEARIVGPGYANVDAAVQKDVELSSGAGLQFRWEVFNLLNRVNFDVPNRIAFTSNFGRVFSAKPPRQMQFGMKLLF